MSELKKLSTGKLVIGIICMVALFFMFTIFVFDDDSIMADIRPWNRPLGMNVEYVVKNPEVLWDVVDIIESRERECWI